MSATYEVIVGNVGTVYQGDSAVSASRAFKGYVAQSKSGVGRAAGESVTRMKNGEIVEEYTPPEPEKLQWWQGRITSPHWDLGQLNGWLQERYPGAPAITGVTERVLFAPLRGVYLCEGQPSMWQEHLDYSAEFQKGDLDWDGWDSVREYADELLMDEPIGDGGQYVHTRSVWNVEANSPIEGMWIATYDMGTFDSDGEGDEVMGQGFYWARETAQGNHMV